MRHGLSGADLADVLGVPANQSQLVASRARTRLDSALGTVLTARPRLGACPELASLLTDSADELTGAERKLVRRHLSTCPICTDHHRPEVNAAALLGAQPAPVPPSGLRFQMLSLLRDTSPGRWGTARKWPSGPNRSPAPGSRPRWLRSAQPAGRSRSSRRPGCWSRCWRCSAGAPCWSRTRCTASRTGGRPWWPRPPRRTPRRRCPRRARVGTARRAGPAPVPLDRPRPHPARAAGRQEDQPPRHPDADQDRAQHAAKLAPGHHAGQHATNYLADDG